VLNIYTNNIDIQTLSPNQRTYVYNFGDYREQITEAAFNEASVIFEAEDNNNGKKQHEMIAQKMALEYLKDNPNPDKEYVDRLKNIILQEHHNWIANQTIDEVKRKYNISN
jgi:hypothetical protein